MHKIVIMDKKKIGIVVRKAKEKKAISYYEINKQANVQRTVVKSIETGDSSYTIDSLLAVGHVLGLSVKVE